jgi:hypothetical protein
MWFGKGRLWIWGGLGYYVGATGAAQDGASFDLASGTWALMPTAPITGRFGASIVWTGESALIWGGRITITADAPNDGAIFTP